ncbi:aminotransferase class V-fold PLP-dependent enzyme [Microbacterium sp. P06]|uniref:aminotransferase class V-fold PLP-dependent enzyme n=1 Tax=unclassified Microbacterium TaxID=2609290 RepID=UPI0037477627
MTDLETYADSFGDETGYLDWASFGPLAPSVLAEATADAELLSSGRRSSIDLVVDNVAEARGAVADLLGAPLDQVVLQPSTAYGLMQAIYALRGTVLVSSAEFPSLTVAAARSAAVGGAQVSWMLPPAGYVTPEVVREALTDDVTAVAVSLVDFRTGYRADLTALREVIGDRLLIVDAIQGFGVVDADYASADVVCGNGYKWLRAGRGTGYSWFGDRALDRLDPVLSGFMGTDVEGLPLDEVPPPARSARAFTVSDIDPLAAGRLATAVGDIREVGVAAIGTRVGERASEVFALAEQHGIPVATPQDSEHRAGIVALAPEAQDAAPLAAALTNHGLAVTVRSGGIRVAVHAGTSPETLRQMGDALAAFAASRVW